MIGTYYSSSVSWNKTFIHYKMVGLKVNTYVISSFSWYFQFSGKHKSWTLHIFTIPKVCSSWKYI